MILQDYAFTSSKYPLVISIENHCNGHHQTRMAKIFRAIFDEMLPEEDLVELEERERLPSPQELQGKIILKGSYEVLNSILPGIMIGILKLKYIICYFDTRPLKLVMMQWQGG